MVRPRIGTGGVSGLGTLLSGAYIGTDAGVSTKSRSEFIGLEAPPFVLRGEPGAVFVLRAEDLGSLDVGSPVFHRRTPVGRVVGYTLDAERDELSLKIFVEAPYQKLVTAEQPLLERQRHRPDAERERPERQHPDARLGARRRHGLRVAARRRRAPRRRPRTPSSRSSTIAAPRSRRPTASPCRSG